MESYRTIKDYPDYKISSCGNVLSLKRKTPKILRKYLDTKGYLMVRLCNEGGQKTKLVHKLVAEAFLGHTPNGCKEVIDHIDSDKQNNNIKNLRIVSTRTNVSKDKKNKHGYTGVHYHKTKELYVARALVEGKRKHIGYYDTAAQAGKAYLDFILGL